MLSPGCDVNKATDCDCIPPRARKESFEILCYPFSELFNCILGESKIPQQWKLGKVSPVFKEDYCLTKANYRPITILPSLSKVFETLMHSRISPYFEDIFHEHVFAYRKIMERILLNLARRSAEKGTRPT